MIDILILLFTYIPTIIVHLVLLSGVFCLGVSIFGFPIPSITAYLTSQTSKYIAIILIALGLFLEGGLAVNQEYIERAKAWEEKVRITEEKAKLVNAEVNTVYIEKIKTVSTVKYIADTRINNSAINMNKECKLLPEVIEVHNYAAKGLEK